MIIDYDVVCLGLSKGRKWSFLHWKQDVIECLHINLLAEALRKLSYKTNLQISSDKQYRYKYREILNNSSATYFKYNFQWIIIFSYFYGETSCLEMNVNTNTFLIYWFRSVNHKVVCYFKLTFGFTANIIYQTNFIILKEELNLLAIIRNLIIEIL